MVLSDEMKEKIADVLNDKPSWSTMLMFDDAAAEIAVTNHEAAHSLHHMRGQTNRDILESQTADMSVEKDYVTEKVAYSVQCLILANLWKQCKDADLKLKELMLGCCNKKNNMIYYTDMLQVKETNEIQTISGELGVFAFNKMDERGDNLTGSKEKSAIKEEKGATKKLSIGEISSALYQNMSR